MRRSMLLTALIATLAIFMSVGLASAQTQTIEFWTMSLSDFADYIQDVIARFEAENPGVKVVWRDVPFTTLREQFLAAVASGNVPDVVNFPAAWAIAMAQRGALYSVDELFTEEELAAYFPGIMNSAKWNNKIWALPWYVTPDMMFINVDIFQRAGLDPNNPPKTWDETIEYARIIMNRTGIYGFSPNFILGDILTREGISLLTADRNVGFNNEQAVEELTKWVQVYRDGLVPPDIVTNVRAGELEGVQRYQAGRLAMLITGPQFISRVRVEAPEIYAKTIAVPLPVGKAGTTRAAIQNIVVSRQSKNPELAADFALFLTNAENQLAFSKIVTIFPSVIAAAEDPFFSAGGNTPEDQARMIAAGDLWKIDATPTDLPDSSRMTQILDDAMTAALLGSKTPRQAIQDAAREWQQILDQSR